MFDGFFIGRIDFAASEPILFTEEVIFRLTLDKLLTIESDALYRSLKDTSTNL